MERTLSAVTKINLDERSITRTLIGLAWPTILENLLVMTVFLVDTVLIGWMRDNVALAAVGLAGTLMFVVNGVFQTLGVSATALVSRAIGGNNRRRANRVASQIVQLAFVGAIAIMLLAIPAVDFCMHLLSDKEDVSQAAAEYMRIILYVSPLSLPLTVITGIFRGSGDTKTPMKLTTVMNVLNAGGAGVLIFGIDGFVPALGLRGAAWAAGVSQAIAGVLAFLLIIYRGHGVTVVPRLLLKWDRRLVARITRIAIPHLGDTVIRRMGHVFFMKLVALLGTIQLAAHNLAIRVESISFMPAFGLSVATTALVGQALGAKKPEFAALGIKKSVRLATLFMTLVGVVFAVCGHMIVTLFGSTPDVLDAAGLAIRISAVEQPFIAVAMIIAGGLQGAGDTRTPMFVSLIGTFLLRLPLVYTFALYLEWGLAGVWWATTLDWVGRAIMLWIHYGSGKWKKVRV